MRNYRRWEGGEGEGRPCPILKIEKKCPDFVKNALTVSISELNFLGEKTQVFPCGAFFSDVFNKMFVKVP